MPRKRKNKSNKVFEIITKLGLLLVALALLGLLTVFYPVLVKEIGYRLGKKNQDVKVLTPIDGISLDLEKEGIIVAADKDFSLIVPKINANSKVVSDVDPYKSKVYQIALTKGVAHAKGTVYPGQVGNSFYFAHSSDNFFNANRYNSVFYLLNKMEEGDVFYLVYRNEIYRYKVGEVRIVSAESVEYLTMYTNKKLATLMTCWPAGTTLQRLVVVGELVEE